jgi:hypothetical protein
MGGSGGGFPTGRSDINRLAEEAERARQEADRNAKVNELINSKLAEINDRDAEAISNYLEEIEGCLGEDYTVDQLLYGGSVAKHTFVDGLSDVDSLVILDHEGLEGMTPEEVRDGFAESLRKAGLEGVAKLEAGLLAVTVTYDDGTEIQLLPAVLRGEHIAISAPDAKSWSSTDPRAFREALTEVNKRQRGAVIPAIKLAKAVIGNFAKDDRLAGYHVEALAVAAFRDYDGPRDQRSMVSHLFASASENIRSPIRDVTGQSPFVDERLGARDSTERRRLATVLRRTAERMKNANDGATWENLFG